MKIRFPVYWTTLKYLWGFQGPRAGWEHKNRPLRQFVTSASCLIYTASCRHHCGSVAKSCLTLCNPKDCSTPASLPLTMSQSSPKFMSIELMMPSNYLILSCSLLLPSVFPSIKVFSSESAVRSRWLKYWTVSFSISPSNEYSGLISFRIDWFNLFVVQGTLKHLLQHHYMKVSILWHSAFFIVQLSHPYMTTGTTIALTVWNFVGKVMSAF